MPASFEPLVPFSGLENIVASNSLGLEKESWLISVGFGEAVVDFVTANHQSRRHCSTGPPLPFFRIASAVVFTAMIAAQIQ